MGDIARCSTGNPGDYYNENLLYKLFGVNAELLIDHAWGWEPCAIADVKAYKPESSSISSGQVLQCPYPYDKAKLVVREMTDLLVLDLVGKGLVTDQLVLTVGYDIDNFTDDARKKQYHGAVTTDQYGRAVPKHAHGTESLGGHTSSTKQILEAVGVLFDRIIDPNLLVRRIYVVANHVVHESDAPSPAAEQLDLFNDYGAAAAKKAQEDAALAREKKQQQAILKIINKFGKNAILKGMNLQDGATAAERNKQIGGHKA